MVCCASSCLAQAPDWQEIKLINGFHVQQYIDGKEKRIITYDSSMYVLRTNDTTWTKDRTYGDEKIYRLVYTSAYEVTMPSCQIRNLATGSIYHFTAFDSLPHWVRVDIRNDTICFLTQDEVVVLNALDNSVIARFSCRMINIDDIFLFNGVLLVLSNNSITHYRLNGEEMGSTLLSTTWYEPVADREKCGESIVLGHDDWIGFYDFKTGVFGMDTMRVVFQSDWMKRVLCYIVQDTVMYVVLDLYGYDALLTKVNIPSGMRVDLDTIRSYDGTGIYAAWLWDVTDTTYCISDCVQGGLFTYDRRSKAIQWNGDGIHEVGVLHTYSNRQRMYLLTNAGLYEYDGMRPRKWKNLYFWNSWVDDFFAYRDSVVIFDVVIIIYGRDDEYRKNSISNETVTGMVVYRDTTIYYSDNRGLFAYNNGILRYLTKEYYCELACSDSILATWKRGTLKVHNLNDGRMDSLFLQIYSQGELKAVSESGSLIVLRMALKTIVYDYIQRKEVWNNFEGEDYLDCITWNGAQYVVYESGIFRSIEDGSEKLRVDPNLRGVTVFRDTCYLFYDHGRVLRSATGGISEVVRNVPERPILRMYPNPARDMLYIELHPGNPAPLHIAVFDCLGRCRIARNWESVIQGSSELAIPLDGLPAGTYFLFAGDAPPRPFVVLR